MTVRTRIAPSPTGTPHVGTAYVAIFNLAFARQHGGQFLLRIEDTDRTRSDPQYETMIFESLRWLGLHWDEGPDVGGLHGPYRQSERTHVYQRHVKILLDRGTAYPCFCTPERLERMRDEQKAAGRQTMYDGLCRTLSAAEAREKLDANVPHVVRQAIPRPRQVTFSDRIRGDVTIATDVVDDQVLLKSDGYPTYHLASVVDDHLMQISHVMRAEEWINSTPKHVLLYEAFGWDPPEFAHLPLLRNQDRSKISKRKNPVSLKWYEEEGYLPEAMVNFLGMMGFSMPDGREIFGFADIQEAFAFERINPAGPVFDLDKLGWLNGAYIRNMELAELTRRLVAFGYPEEHIRAVQPILPLIYERMRRLKDFGDVCDFFMTDTLAIDPATLVPKKRTAEETAPVLNRFAERMEALEAWDKDTIEPAMRELTAELGWPTKDSFMAVRVAVTGKTATPPLVESIGVLGRERTVKRLREAAALLK